MLKWVRRDLRCPGNGTPLLSACSRAGIASGCPACPTEISRLATSVSGKGVSEHHYGGIGSSGVDLILFVAQCHHRVDLCSAARGNQSRRKRGKHEQERDRGKSGRVARLHFEQKLREHTRESERSRGADCDARAYESERSAEHHP